MTIFEGSAVALVLPMFDNGDIDFEGFKKQVQRMIDGGVQALLVNGTTGETATITIEDEFKLLDLTLELAKGTGVKVICGAGSNDTQTALKKARYAKEKGADAILVVTPYYNKTSQNGLGANDVLENGSIHDDYRIDYLRQHIQAMKDATDNIAYAMEVLAKTADLDFDLYSGCDDNILPFMAAGGKGVISVTSNLYPEAVEKLTQLILKGNIKEAQPLAYALDPISRLLFIDVNPIMPKAALAKMGVCGEYGLMGKKVAHQLREKDEFDLIGVVSYEFDEKAPEAMYSNLTEVQDRADVIIDFSHPNNLDDILAYAKKNKTKVVFATTGFSKEQLDKIEEASKEIAIFQSYNTSFGIQMVTKILRQVAKEFYDNGYDIEILEKHHNQKIDAPSGTAKLLYEVMEDEIQGTTPVYDRSSLHEKRKKEEIGIQALRGGTIFGEHEIMFAGLDEIIEIKHTALSKDVFVQGALAAAKALQDKEAGLFTLKTLY